MWDQFLSHPQVFCHPFIEFQGVHVDEIEMYSDASKGELKGFGAICQCSWMYGQWPEGFIKEFDPSIEFLELFGVTAGVLQWINRFQNRRIYLFCDNQSVVHMINNSSSKCKDCMTLIHIIMLESMLQNVRVFCKHVTSRNNRPSDVLLRLQISRFKEIFPQAELEPMPIPDQLWPVSKLFTK